MIRRRVRRSLINTVILVAVAASASAQQATGESTRAGTIEKEQAKKAAELHPYIPGKVELFVDHFEEGFLHGKLTWYPFLESAYAGGGFTVGAGWRQYVGLYNSINLQGSITFKGYKRVEAEFLAPRVFNRRGVLSVIGGWREATQVGFYGIGTSNTSVDDRVNYSFDRPYAAISLNVHPTSDWLLLGGAVEYSQWKQGPGSGAFPSVEEVYTPETLPGLGASPTYLHTTGIVALDWRTSPGYTRRGGFYGVELHDYADPDDAHGFRQVNYLANQHIPVLHDVWVVSLRGSIQTTYPSGDATIPFFMLPGLGGGSSMRGFTSWRFRDRHSLLLSAELRVLANRFLDMAVFYDAGKVVARTSDLDLNGLKSDYGLGFRLHGPASTPLRIEVARSNEHSFKLIFSTHASF